MDTGAVNTLQNASELFECCEISEQCRPPSQLETRRKSYYSHHIFPFVWFCGGTAAQDFRKTHTTHMQTKQVYLLIELILHGKPLVSFFFFEKLSVFNWLADVKAFSENRFIVLQYTTIFCLCRVM